MPGNIPLQPDHSGNAVVDDFFQRGFVKIKPEIPEALLRSAAAAIEDFPQPVSIRYPGLESVSFALLGDEVSITALDSNSTPIVIGVFEKGFMNFAMHASFLRDFTDIHRFVDSLQRLSGTPYQRKLAGLIPAEYTAGGKYKLPKDENVVVANDADPRAIFEAEKFFGHIDEANTIAVSFSEIMAHLDYMKYLNFSIFSGGTVFAAIRYGDDATTFGDNPDDPSHTDDNKKSMSGSINLGTTPRKCVIGRTPETREVVWQMPGELLLIDNEGTRDRPRPIHMFEGGMSMLFVINGDLKKDFIRDEMTTFEAKGLWKPSVPQLWVAGQSSSAPDFDGR